MRQSSPGPPSGHSRQAGPYAAGQCKSPHCAHVRPSLDRAYLAAGTLPRCMYPVRAGTGAAVPVL